MKSKSWMFQLAAGISFLLAGTICLSEVNYSLSVTYFAAGIMFIILSGRTYKSNRKLINYGEV